MSLKGEIGKLVSTEQAKLESRDRKHAEYRDRQRKRFVALRAILEELAHCVDRRFLRVKIEDGLATLEVGREETTNFSADLRWRIQPNYSIYSLFNNEESLFNEAEGFRIEETEYYRYPEYDSTEVTRTYVDEKAVAEYLVKKMAEKVAHYRHLETTARKG